MIFTRSMTRTSKRHSPFDPKPGGTPAWKRVAGIGGLVLACLASPCCAPLLVPVVLSLLVGTPLSYLLAEQIGWIYASLTVLSLVSAYFGWRALTQREAASLPVQEMAASRCTCQMECSCRPIRDADLAMKHEPT